ncbi:redoxin domain-containing protein [Gemmata sp. JC673]|uniref:Redoxin domain-containing protein n=1 Tax=Gemmata algarum TaxID=2975278 RepID=A0ABU5ETZ9_9BACT|nr:redoxin domain-containing protein [Gemmata algarum]MDY3558787.1 redoxin domain-containing protein [Gemmata algarum]
MLHRTLVALSLALGASPLTAGDQPAPIGAKVADFTLTEPLSGKPWALNEQARDAKATVIAFTALDCPVCKAYWGRLADLRKRYTDDGVVFVAVNSQLTDSAGDVARAAKDLKLPFPLLKDDGTKLADKLAVSRVLTVVVLDATRTVRYAGRIDDQFAPGVHRDKATTRELASALDAVLEGREVKKPFTAAAGCRLTREKKPATAAAVSYHKHVAAIFQSKCQECHRAGEVGPFALTSYKQAKGWADMIREVVADGVMPPWHADAPTGHFKNDRRLSAEEKKTLLAWIDAGCPEGDPKDAPAPAQFIDGWRLPQKPDLVLKMNQPFDVPATSLLGMGIPYQHITVGAPLKEDMWVQAAEVRPDYRAVVHHVIVYMVPPKGRLDHNNFARYMVGTYVPGDQPLVYPEGMAKKVPKGSQLMFEVHYTPNGTAGKDQSVLGIVLAKKPPAREAKGDAALNVRFAIPPGAENHQVTASHTFEKPTTLLSLSPHMHLRGKAFKYELVTKDGTRETLLNVPKYDFNWQLSYALTKPRELPAGSKIECTAWYDNSAKNPFNPNPGKKVTWGDQTWDEMMIGFFEYYDTP